MKAASWLLAECVGCQVLLGLRSGSSLGCILAACSVDSCVRLLVKQDILIMIESVFMSTFGCFILSEQLFTASKNKSNDDKLCMISNFYNKILYINFKCLILEST